MPIKACTRCGLKVLVDAATAASDEYLCPRCAPDAKPSTAPSSKPSAPSGKRASVKVTCPYCGASFSGSKPSRPAKGGCPVCQKELILLPDGTIQAASTFNLAAWQKERKSASNPPAPAPDATIEMPAAADPLGGATILDMGGPGGAPPPPSIDEPTMALPGGLGGETMLGMGSDIPSSPSPAPTIDEPAPEPEEPPREAEPTSPPDLDLGGATILDMGPRAVELPPPEIEEPVAEPDLLSDTMPGMDRPPAEESPVDPPIPPPIPEPPVYEEPPVDVTEGPTIRETEPPAPEEPAPIPKPEPEPEPSSMESAPEIPVDMGGQTILGLGGDFEPPKPPPVPSIEEPEAVPILAKDAPFEPPADPAPPAEAPAGPAQTSEKPYVYQPIPRKPRSAPAPAPPPPAAPPPAPSLPPVSGAPAPLLGSDFRIASVPPAPPPKSVEREREERRPAGPKTT